jgi:hypothetical protein
VSSFFALLTVNFSLLFSFFSFFFSFVSVYYKQEAKMPATQTANTPSFETVWALMQENALQMKELRESQKENAERLDREMKESAERLNREMKESAERLDKQIGRLGNRFGEVIEYIVMPNLVPGFREMGFVFEKAYPHAIINDKTHKIYAEIDITLENGDRVMITEVKSKPTTEDVAEHIERMDKVRQHGDLHGDRRVFLGAIAGMVFNDNVKHFALKNGFYVIEPSGETFVITAPEGEYSPREW